MYTTISVPIFIEIVGNYIVLIYTVFDEPASIVSIYVANPNDICL